MAAYKFCWCPQVRVPWIRLYVISTQINRLEKYAFFLSKKCLYNIIHDLLTYQQLMHHYIVPFQVLFLCELSTTSGAFEFRFYATFVFQMGHQIGTIFVLFLASGTVEIERTVCRIAWKKQIAHYYPDCTYSNMQRVQKYEHIHI